MSKIPLSMKLNNNGMKLLKNANNQLMLIEINFCMIILNMILSILLRDYDNIKKKKFYLISLVIC
jgi:hypothetical protein